MANILPILKELYPEYSRSLSNNASMIFRYDYFLSVNVENNDRTVFSTYLKLVNVLSQDCKYRYPRWEYIQLNRNTRRDIIFMFSTEDDYLLAKMVL